MFHFWIAWRYLKGGRRFLGITAILSILGMALGVASLVVAMAVVSGYETTLKDSVIDVFGHLVVVKRGSNIEGREQFIKQVKGVTDNFEAATPFVTLEAIIAHNKKLSGVVLQGVESKTVDKVLNIKSRVIAGEFVLNSDKGIDTALIGKGIAKNFDLKKGDIFRVVMPVGDKYDPEKFRPRMKRFSVSGVLDLGRHDFDSRTIVTSLKAAQDFANVGDRFTGMRLKLDDADLAGIVGLKIAEKLGFPYWTRDWREVNSNLFDAVAYEKFVLFLVISVMVLAACFNIASTLFVSVLRRYVDVSVLKTMGASRWFVMRIFTIQGLMVGAIGTVLGVVLGLFACWAFMWAQNAWGLVPGEIYKLDRIQIEVRAVDLALIFGVSLLVCFFATLVPAYRGSRLSPIEGLRYD